MDDSFGQLSPEEQQQWVNEFAHNYGQQGPSQGPSQPTEPGQEQPEQDPSQGPSEATQAAPDNTQGEQPQTPQQAPSQAPSGLFDAAKASVLHGLPASLAGGLATLGRTLEDRTGMHGTVFGEPMLDDAIAALTRAQANQKKAYGESYQHPADVDPSPIHALGQGHLLGSLKSLAYGTAENLGTTGAALGAGALAALNPEVSIPALLTSSALGTTLAADSVNEGRRASGLDADKPLTNTDLSNLAVQALINSSPLRLGGAGAGLSKGAQSAMLAGGSFARGALDSLANSSSEAAQGGDVGGLKGASQAAFDNGLFSLGAHAAGSAAGKVVETNQRALDQALVGSEARKGLSELAALQSNPDPDARLSPAAQKTQATIDLKAFVDPRAASQSKVNPNVHATDTIKSDLDTGVHQLKTIADYLKEAGPENGGVSKEDHEVLVKAIGEAARHNREQADYGADSGYSDTYRDRIRSMSLDPELKSAFLNRLAVLDTEAYNGKKKNTLKVAGPTINAALHNMPNVGAALGVGLGATHGALGAELGGVTGAAIGAGLRALQGRLLTHVARKAGDRVDTVLGIGVPPALSRSGAIQRIAERKGLLPSVTPSELQNIEDSWRETIDDLRSNRQTRSKSAFSSKGPSKAPLQGTQAPSQGPSPGSPAPSQGPSMPLLNLAVASRRNPGWMGSRGAGAQEPNPVRIHNWLSNMRDSGQLSPDDYHYLTTTDHIGDALGRIQNLIGDLQSRGLWEQASAPPKGASQAASQGPSQGASTSQKGRDPNLQGASQATPLDAEGNAIKSLYLYQQKARQNAKARDNIKAVHPELSDIADDMHDAVLRDEKRKLMQDFLSSVKDEDLRKTYQLVLNPLTRFGKEKKTK